MRLGAVHQVAKFRRILSEIAYGLDSITAPDSFSAERFKSSITFSRPLYASRRSCRLA